MREMLLGVIAVGVVAGVYLGRHSERARRSYKDVGTAKTNLTKNQATFKSELRRAIVVVLFAAATIVGMVTLAVSTRSGD